MTNLELKHENARLRAEAARMREILTVEAACRWFDYFHNVPAEKACPACGGDVELQYRDTGSNGDHYPRGYRLVAVRS